MPTTQQVQKALRDVIAHTARRMRLDLDPGQCTTLATAATQTLAPHLNTTTAAADYQVDQRMIDVLRHMANGLENAEIAARLFIAEDTVKSHVRRTLARLGAANRTHAVGIAIAHGLISPAVVEPTTARKANAA